MARLIHLVALIAVVTMGLCTQTSAQEPAPKPIAGTVPCNVTVTITDAFIVTNGPNGPILTVQYTVQGTTPTVGVQSVTITYQQQVETQTVTPGQPATKSTSAGTVFAVPAGQITSTFDPGNGVNGNGQSTAVYNHGDIEQGRKDLHTTKESNGSTIITNAVGPLVVSITVVGFDGTPCSNSATKSFEYQKLRAVKK